MLAFQPVEDKKVYQQIIEQLKDMIYQGELKKGDKLPSERALTKELNVSRSSLREAFSALEMIGLIESRHGEGTFIRENNDDRFLKPLSLLFMIEDNVDDDLIELRKIIEASVAKLVAWRAKQEEIEELKKCIESMEAAKGDIRKSSLADREFHYILAKASGNRLLYKFLNSISEVIDIYLSSAMERIVRDENKNNTFVRQHRDIYDAIKCGDKDLAEQAMREHLDWSADLMDV